MSVCNNVSNMVLSFACSKETLGDMDLCCHGSMDSAKETIYLTCLD